MNSELSESNDQPPPPERDADDRPSRPGGAAPGESPGAESSEQVQEIEEHDDVEEAESLEVEEDLEVDLEVDLEIEVTVEADIAEQDSVGESGQWMRNEIVDYLTDKAVEIARELIKDLAQEVSDAIGLEDSSGIESAFNDLFDLIFDTGEDTAGDAGSTETSDDAILGTIDRIFNDLLGVIVDRADNWLEDSLPVNDTGSGPSTEAVVDAARNDDVASLMLDAGRDFLDLVEQLVNIANLLRPK